MKSAYWQYDDRVTAKHICIRKGNECSDACNQQKRFLVCELELLNCFFCSNFRAVFYYLFLVLRVLSKASACQCGSLICVAPSNVVGLALMGMARSSHSYRTKEEQIYCSNIAYTDNLENHTNSNGREMYFLRRLRRRLEK